MGSSVGYKVVYNAPLDIQLKEMTDIPEIKSGEVLVKVEACAICGSDIKSYKNGNPRMRSSTVIGHEFCGEIVAVGAGVSDYRAGQRVTMATTMGCGECYYCKEGKFNICINAQAIGFHCDGAMASYVVIPQKAVRGKNLVPVGDLDAEVACLSEPMSCAINSLTRTPISEINSALVIGIGALGIMHSIALREYGVENIICVGNEGIKRDILESLDFSVVDRDKIDECFLELTNGQGFDLVIITAPSNRVQCDALKYARKGGWVSYFSSLPVGDHEITINSRTLHYGELVLYGTSDSTAEHVKEAVRILEKHQNDIKKTITTLPLTSFHEGLKGLLDKRYAKVVLKV